jgi:hypothetical protein
MQVLARPCHRLAQPAAARERAVKLGHELRGGHDINRIAHGDHAGSAGLHHRLRQRAVGFDLGARRFGLGLIRCGRRLRKGGLAGVEDENRNT